MNHTFQTLEFNRILEKLESFSHTETAKEQIRNLTPELKEAEVRKNLRDTTQARMILDRMGQPPAVAMNGMTAIFKSECLPAALIYK